MECNGMEYEHTRLSVEGKPDVWFRRRVGQEKQAEIITDDKEVMEILTGLAKENPEIVEILAEEGDEHFHAIAGPELVIELKPSAGSICFWIEQVELME